MIEVVLKVLGYALLIFGAIYLFYEIYLISESGVNLFR